MTKTNKTPSDLEADQLSRRLLEIFKVGSQGEFTVGPLTKAQCTSLRHRLYRFRRKMHEVRHPEVMAAEACTIEIKEQPNGIFSLLIYPTLMHIENALKNSGLSTSEPPPLDEEDGSGDGC